MPAKSDAPFGDYTTAKLDYLAAASKRIDAETGERGGIAVNRMHARPLHPHGLRMIRDGLMRIARHDSFTKTCRHTVLVITDDGLAELARLNRRAAKIQRRDDAQTPTLDALKRPRIPAIIRARKTRAIAFLAESKQHLRLVAN
ncbi:hypothetical protein ACOI1H_20745 [Loktanella sp. DJP18]|uniref:hypothetical protein n=1 Tax=Loktanella sp. DJP18 TaxID=3409788 RepID=UPI003BB80148